MPGCSGECSFGESHSHDHGEAGGDTSSELYPSLFPYIHVDQVTCLNEVEVGSIKKILKPSDRRFDRSDFVESNDGDQLIIYVPFTGSMKVMSISVAAGGPLDDAPSVMKLFTNRMDVDFGNVERLIPVYEMAMAPTQDIVQYPLRISKFTNVHSITLYFPNSFLGERLRLFYLGFHGVYSPLTRDPLITLYELHPNLADHTTSKADTKVDYGIF